ncbi:MAG: polysaccharide deacetylase family protein [Blastocatellia bacterium]
MHSIFVYHTISSPPAPLPANIDVSADLFETHLEWLSKHRKMATLDQILSCADSVSLSAVTFDDGFRDNLTTALPLLKKYNVPAAIFVTPDFLDKKDYLTREELQSLSGNPLITIGAHGLTHQHFSRLSRSDARHELLESKAQLQEITGRTIDLMAWPYGDCNSELEILAEVCGYRAAWSVWNGDNSQYSLWRVPIGRPDNLVRFIAKASKYYFPVKQFIRPAKTT